jgi:2-aminoethylphosphonate-pyruvate transaminase
MSNHSRDPIHLTPGPLTTSLSTKTAMLRDWGSWDSAFNAVTARLRARLMEVIGSPASHVCIPLQGSGTFAVEAAINTLVPRDGHLLVLVNGAYGKRMARLTTMMGRRCTLHEAADDQAITGADLERLLARDPSITDVGVIHCETSTGIQNPLPQIAAVAARHGKRLIVDAMSSFGALPIDAREVPFDALVAASGKCIEGPPGMGFVFARKALLQASEGNCTSLSLDLHDQWVYMEKTTQWRFTPPTHVVVALDTALDEFRAEGGQPARLARYRANCKALVEGMAGIGLRPFQDTSIPAPIIVTFQAPDDARYTVKEFY